MANEHVMPIDPEDLEVGRVVVVLGPRCRAEISEDYHDAPEGMRGVIGMIAGAQARSRGSHFEGVPLRVLGVELPFVILACPLCGQRGPHVDVRDYELGWVGDAYTNAFYSGRGCSSVHPMDKDEPARPWWKFWA